MKKSGVPWEVMGLIALIGGSLMFIQSLHLAKHDAYCKTYAEWVDTLPPDLRYELRE